MTEYFTNVMQNIICSFVIVLLMQHEEEEDGRRKRGLLKALAAMSSVFFLIYLVNKWMRKTGRVKKIMSPQQLEQIFHATVGARAGK